MTTPTTTTTRWCGWWRRPGQPWRLIVKAATEDEARDILRLEVGASGFKLLDTWVGPAGTEPAPARGKGGRRG